MKRATTWLGWPVLGLLATLLVAIPPASARPDSAALTPEEKQKQIELLEKQKLELQKKIEELKAAPAASISPKPTAPEGTIPDDYMKPFAWRNVGPANMGGRVTALAVVESDPTTYYIATASGGLLKTINNGTTFDILFDQQSTVSIGDVAVSASNPEIVWIGTGENNPRNSVSYGDGVYKSTDGGKKWTNMGLAKTFQTGKILIHPKNPDIVYVGALGRLYGPNPDRGVFKTEDGGKTWAKVCYVDDKTGVIDMRMDPNDPNTVIAAFWEHKRDGFDGFFPDDKEQPPDQYGPIVTHGAGGGLYKTADAGKTWKKLTDDKLKNGLPTVKTGRIGLDYSHKTKGLLYAIIDTEKVGTGEFARIYLGIIGEDAKDKGGAKLTEITPDAPAAKSGLKANDVVINSNDKKIETYDGFVASYQDKVPGDKIKVTVQRDGKEQVIEVTLGKRPTANAPNEGTNLPPISGVVFGAKGLAIQTVNPGGPADKAGIKVGDVILAVDDKKVASSVEYAGALVGKKAGDKAKLTVERETKSFTVEVTLAPRAATNPAGSTVLLPGFVPTISGPMAPAPLTVASLPAGGPAEKAGVKAGDLIAAVNGKSVATYRDFITELRVGPRIEEPRKAGDKVKITFKQGEKTLDVELALVETVVPGAQQTGGGRRGANDERPYGVGLGGQQANVQVRQGKDAYQTGGVFVSKDNGDTWTRVNSINPRPMYFSQIRVDPTDDKTLYLLSDVPTIYRSTDGGAKFDPLTTAAGVHADAHALWIDPTNSKHLIIGCDGGFYVSYDKGAKWDHLNTLALGQFYHVAVDNRRPYRIYGGLQDNGSWGGPSHTLRRYGPVNEDWVYVSGGDGFVCRVDPTDPDLVYAESQGGAMNRRNFRTGQSAGMRPARKEGEEPLRFNWNTPFILSSHNPSIFYCGAQAVYRSVKKGDELKRISPELTRTKKGSMTAVAESPRNQDILWAGTDDGFVWTTSDGGITWTNVTANFTSAGLAGPRCVATIEPSRDKDGRCYIAFDAHRSDDDKPYAFVTEDGGKTFKSINANLPAFGSTRCLREDMINTDVLYLGTEFGAWVSANRGASWTKLGVGLPTVPVHEFAQPTTANELVIATHGRSVWILDINAIRQMKPAALKEKAALFSPAPAVRWKLGVGGESPYSTTDRKFVGTNPARGASVDYLLTEKATKVSAKVLDASGRTVHTFEKPPTAAGVHRLSWNLSGPAPQNAPGGGGGRRNLAGAQVQPGVYRVVLTVGEKEFAQPITVELDPNAPRDLIATDAKELVEEDEDDEEMEKKPIKLIDD